MRCRPIISASLRHQRRGYSLIEVLVSLAILLGGVVAIIFLIPNALKASSDAAFLTEATLLAQMKAEEIRRDDDAYSSGTLMRTISMRTTETTPVPFPQNPNLAYSFIGNTVMYSSVPTGDPRGEAGVPRVIVRYANSYRSSQEVVYELRFGN
jgi:prepilin-type N-terminal cleavage/methylation domain-containing protein